MIDFENESKPDLDKFLDHFPHEGDLTIQLLKGHLLVEELLREIFKLQLPFPDALIGNKGASFSCHQIICLVEAITPHSQVMPWIWLAAKKLNNIRNDLAHNLSPEGLESKISDLVKYVNSESPEIQEEAAKIETEEKNELLEVIVSMCACLSSLKLVLEKHVKHRA
jgi:hypothetical protein